MAQRKSIFARGAIHIILAPRGLISKLANLFQEITKLTRPNNPSMSHVLKLQQISDCAGSQ